MQRLGTIIAGIWIELNDLEDGVNCHHLLSELSGRRMVSQPGVRGHPANRNCRSRHQLESADQARWLLLPDRDHRDSGVEGTINFAFYEIGAWFQAKILRMPIEVPIVPRRRVALFAIYAMASGAYSYLLLFFVVRLSYRLGSKWFAEFALIPSAALAFTLFRSRLRSLRGVAGRVWKNLKPGFRWRSPYLLAGLGLLALLFVPLWRDREDAYFVIEPSETHTICAAVPGRIAEVLVQEGQRVRAGQALLRMTSYQAASMQSEAQARTKSASFRVFSAQMHGESGGTAAADQVAARRMTGLANEAQSLLELATPTDGTIVTENPSLLVDKDVGSGQPLIELAEGSRDARIFIPSSALNRISSDSDVTLALPGEFTMLRLKLAKPAGDPVSLPPGLIPAEKYQGFTLPVFYSSRVPLPTADGNPMYGLSGQAKVFGARRSLAGRVAMVVSDLVKAHVW